MKCQPLRAVSIVMYVLCAVATVMLIVPSFTDVRLSHGEKFITAVIIFAFGYMASRLLCIGVADDIAARIMKTNFIWLFLIYVIVVIDFTLISESFGENIE